MVNIKPHNAVAVLENGQIFDFQIIMVSFRPISFFEIDDSYDELVAEIKRTTQDGALQDKMLEFIQAFKSTIESKTIEPLSSFLKSNGEARLDPKQIEGIYQSIQTYLSFESNQNHRLLN